MGGHSSIAVRGQIISHGDRVRYEGKDYTFFEMTDHGEIYLRDPLVDWDFTRVDPVDFDFGHAVFVCKKDDPRFFIGNYI